MPAQINPLSAPPPPPVTDTLARRLGETAPRTPLAWRASAYGLGDDWDLLALAVARGCRHLATVAPMRRVPDPGTAVLKNEELVVLLLGGAQRFEPFLIRAAGELLRAVPIDVARLASLARRERCARVLAHLARLGCQHDAGGAAFWQELRDAIGPQRTVSGGVLPHWTRFVLLNGVNRTGQALDSRWVGTIP